MFMLLRKTLLVVVLGLSACIGSFSTLAKTCPPEGSGTHNDPKQNVLKNRDAAPESLEDMAIGEFKKQLKPNLKLPTRRENFSDDQLALVEPQEKREVTLTAYILRAVKQGPESANCGSTTRTDIHVWLYTKTNSDKAERNKLRSYAVVAEVTPRWLDHHPEWIHTRLEKFGRDRIRVRVSGWVMYDPEHPPHLGKTRGTLWEIHPITKIEYWSGTVWKPL